MDVITLGLGAAATKWVFRSWLGDEPFTDLSTDLVDLVRGRIGDVMEGRRASRQFEQLSELMAKRLDPFIEREFRGEDANERRAAAQAVQDTLEEALQRHLDPVSLDLDAALLEGAIRGVRPDAAARAMLSDGATALYNLLLTECCNYIVSATSRLPDFHSRAARELLSRDTRIIEIGEEVLSRLPLTLPESWGSGSEDEIFASKYTKAVVQRNDRIQLFGVRDRQYRNAYSLSVAYISLTATVPLQRVRREESRVAPAREVNPSRTDDPEDSSADEEEPPDGHDTLEDDVLRVEAALSGHPRLVLGGGAGSGKTTLLQWIAVTASQEGFSEELADWNGTLPFLLPLRRFANAELPAPEEFVRVNHPALSGVMPDGWVHRVLADGRGLVLIDGLDELPDGQRRTARAWLEDLISAFPDSRFVLTSRPLALSQDWEEIDGFRYSELLPMQRPDVRAFITHWHAAAMQDAATDEDKASVRTAELRMISAAHDVASIRTLCTSPLLCALICAMHRVNVNRLPTNRMDLYETALQMLVSSRDEEREVAAGAIAGLTYTEKRALLSDFALWLHESGASDADLVDYQRIVRNRTAELARQTGLNPAAVADSLLERSGVLRTPIEGRVDFVHRTFLEYLAAAELVDDEAVDKIVEHAHLDQWREVVIMSAGHFSARRRQELLRNLVARGKAETSNRHKLFLLAVACIETSPVLGEEVQRLLMECLDEVVPPRNMTEAAAVSSAGSLAVPRLRRDNDMLATTAAACVRALSLIGTDEALDVLKTYRGDSRVTVSRQLIKAWRQFEPDQYAREVLSGSPLDRGHIVFSDPEQLGHLPLLRNAESAYLDFPGKINQISELAPSELVLGLNASRAKGMVDLRGISRFPNLRTLWLENSPSLESLDGLQDSRELRTASLAGCGSLHDLDALASFDDLYRVDVVGTGAVSLRPLHLVKCQQLRIGGQKLISVDAELAAQAIQLSGSPNIRDLTWVDDTHGLQRLTIFAGSLNPGLELPVPQSVLDLSVYTWGPADSMPRIRGGQSVHRLRLWGECLPPPHLESLRSLEVQMDSLGAWIEHGLMDWSLVPNLLLIEVWGRGVDEIEIPGFSARELRGKPPSQAHFIRVES